MERGVDGLSTTETRHTPCVTELTARKDREVREGLVIESQNDTENLFCYNSAQEQVGAGIKEPTEPALTVT